MNDKQLQIEQATIKAVQLVLKDIEEHFLDQRHTQYRHELSKKYWNKLKRKYG